MLLLIILASCLALSTRVNQVKSSQVNFINSPRGNSFVKRTISANSTVSTKYGPRVPEVIQGRGGESRKRGILGAGGESWAVGANRVQ